MTRIFLCLRTEAQEGLRSVLRRRALGPAVAGRRRPMRRRTTALLAAYSPPAAPLTPSRKRDAAAIRRIDGAGIVCLWKLHRTSFPWAVLRCAGTPLRVALPSAKPYLAFAGTAEGAVQLWDLREVRAWCG